MLIGIGLLVVSVFGWHHRRKMKMQAKRKRPLSARSSVGSASSVEDTLRAVRQDKRHWFRRFRTKFKILASTYQVVSQFEEVLEIR